MPKLTMPIRCRGVLLKVLVRRPSALESVGPVQAFLDTGASDSMLDAGIVQSMCLPAVRCAALNVLGRLDVSYHETFEVEIAIPGDNVRDNVRWLPLTVLGGAVFSTGVCMALGRDFLRHVVLTYDGPAAQASLAW